MECKCNRWNGIKWNKIDKMEIEMEINGINKMEWNRIINKWNK
jgi:hypothetical protein